MVKGGSEVFGDGDGKVGEVGLLVPWRCPFGGVTYTCRRTCLVECDTWKRKRTAKERLYLHTTDAANLARTEHETTDVSHALAINR